MKTNDEMTKERPILFQGAMVSALLAGSKTQTRRVAKPMRGYEHNNVCRPDMAAESWDIWWHGQYETVGVMQGCPYGQPGDRLWVRESFWGCDLPGYGDQPCIVYDDEWIGKEYEPERPRPWARKFGRIPSIHMPRDASRILLEIVNVRAEQLATISEADAIAEGVNPAPRLLGEDDLMVEVIVQKLNVSYPVARYVLLWDSINGAPDVCWEANPWVWVVEFKRVPA